MRKIKDVHKHSRPAPQVEVIPNTYDPSSGCTFYFTDTGEQVHKMPTYVVPGDRKARNPNFDDMPDVDTACSKLFDLATYFPGSAQCMGTAMGSILL